MIKRITAKYIKWYILDTLQEEITHRDIERGTGVYLAENIGAYYMQVGSILALQKLCKHFNIKSDLVNYDPFEQQKDDLKYNYCASMGKIGRRQ